nr:MAG: ORF5b protein [Rhinolophus bat coronavirus HKU32]
MLSMLTPLIVIALSALYYCSCCTPYINGSTVSVESNYKSVEWKFNNSYICSSGDVYDTFNATFTCENSTLTGNYSGIDVLQIECKMYNGSSLSAIVNFTTQGPPTTVFVTTQTSRLIPSTKRTYYSLFVAFTIVPVVLVLIHYADFS